MQTNDIEQMLINIFMSFVPIVQHEILTMLLCELSAY